MVKRSPANPITEPVGSRRTFENGAVAEVVAVHKKDGTEGKRLRIISGATRHQTAALLVEEKAVAVLDLVISVAQSAPNPPRLPLHVTGTPVGKRPKPFPHLMPVVSNLPGPEISFTHVHRLTRKASHCMSVKTLLTSAIQANMNILALIWVASATRQLRKENTRVINPVMHWRLVAAI